MGIRFLPVAAALSFAAAPAFTQNPDALARNLEGRHVVLKMDLPGDTGGVDVWPRREFPVDFAKVGDGLRRYGVALRKGDSAMVTKVKVKKKLIEFQLSGGGYSGGSSAPYISTTVSKSSREKDLDDLIDKEQDERRKKRLQKEQRDLRDERHREEARLRVAAAQAQAQALQREREMRATSGSRINLRFKGPVPPDFVSPQALASALADYVEFSEGGSTAAAPAPSGGSLPLRNGMSMAEVEAAFGQPSSRSVETAAGLEVVRHIHELSEATLAASYVDGVLVKYLLGSR